MGMMDWIDGEDEDARSDEEGTGLATDGLGFDEDLDDFGDDFGDFDDDDMEGFDDEDADFGGGGGGGGVDPDTVAELEDRVSDLENEVSATSSSVNTVREENKQIGETVEELDDTVRKLLDIYEMVTRGINPFVDDAREMGGLEGGGSFGLFDAEEEEEEHLDPDVASADAESFFDEDFGELDADAEAEEAELAAEDELAENEAEDPTEEILGDEDPVVEDDEDDAGGGSSFDDLKAEYEEGEGWEEGEAEDVDDGPLDADDLAVEDDDVPTTDGLVGEEEETDEEDDAAEDGIDDVEEELDAADEDPDAAAEPDAATEPDTATEPDDTGSFEFSEPTTETASPTDRETEQSEAEADVYLATLPASYVAESVALEWTRFLVSVGGAIGAARALRQYREQEWISRTVERQMNAHVRNAAASTTAEEPRDLRVEHHKESLTYVSRLAGDVAEARLLEELSHRGGGHRGIRR